MGETNLKRVKRARHHHPSSLQVRHEQRTARERESDIINKSELKVSDFSTYSLCAVRFMLRFISSHTAQLDFVITMPI